ncbi:dihydrofolate reductase [Xylogone sp. PMI_703]|nr:dihydrofolate reductase [Xylogone sp. PMI_703]
MPLPKELTLIVAATQSMGIGLNNALPWTGLRREMAYFARVTKRLDNNAPPQSLNAVIMGRKTWDSIPPKFRPLKNRLNVVISRSHPETVEVIDKDTLCKARSLEAALAYLSGRQEGVSRVFVIGGAQIYGAALELPETKRCLVTRILRDFECDTVFPLALTGTKTETGWVRRSQAEMDAWVGEAVPEGVQEENGTQYSFEMWEKTG